MRKSPQPEEKGEEEKREMEKDSVMRQEGKLDDIEPGARRYYGHLSALGMTQVKPGCLESTCRTRIWIYGSFRLRKVYAVQNTYPDHYKKGHNKWWDGYDGETLLYRRSRKRRQMARRILSQTLVRQVPFAAESKGFCGQIRPRNLSLHPNTE